MPLILRISKLLALENMTQMPATVIAHYLSAQHAQSPVLFLTHSTRYRIPERRPSAPRIKLVIRFVKWRVAGAAGVDAGVGGVLVVFAAAGHFGAFLAEDAKLL